MKLLGIVAASLIFLSPCFGQTKTTSHGSVDADRLRQTCAQILKMTSSEWIAYSNEKPSSHPADPAEWPRGAIAAYSECYEARTKRLAVTLGNSGKAPLMGARGNFRDFEAALANFTTKALAATDADAGSTKAEYAHLYEGQFRYQFYQSYAEKGLLSRPLTAEESDDYAKAKNRFGEVLGLLPDDKLHSVHSAFRQIFDVGPVSEVTRLELYRFAIFLLAPPKDKPFSPPPF
jgi:hypothetical protein